MGLVGEATGNRDMAVVAPMQLTRLPEEAADDHPTRILLVRPAYCRLHGRADPGFDVPLPRLPATNRQRIGIQARFRQEQLVIAGRAAEYVRIGDEGGHARFRFCPDCGSTVCWDRSGGEGIVAVAVGAFADPGFPRATFSVYGTRRHPWVSLPPSVVERWD